MDDSWQKLMGIDCVSEEGPSSPIFHKKKWVVFPKPLKRSSSGTLLFKCPEKKQKNMMKNDSNNSLQSLVVNDTIPTEDEVSKSTTVDEEDPLVIFNTTPTKKYKHKRKTIDLLNCSSRSEGSFCKKSKVDNFPKPSKDPSDITLEKNCNESGPEASTPSIKVTSPKSNKNSLSQEGIPTKSRRKLLYSCNEKINSNLKAKTLTVNDIVKSVIMIDEADIRSSPKKNRPTSFEAESNNFRSVTSLNSRNLKDCPKVENDLTPSPSISAHQSSNDSLRNFMFTEIENECRNTKEILVSNDNKVPIIADSPGNPVDTNPLDETFSNYRFTEIEEDYNRFDHKENDYNPAALSSKSAAIETKRISPKPHNSIDKNACYVIDNKNVLVCHESDAINKSHNSSNNKRHNNLLQDNSLEESYMKSCDENNIFNSTFLAQKPISELETTLDKEHLLSTSKHCFDNLDTFCTEEFRNNHAENHHHELNESVKEDVLNRSMDNSENDVLNKSVSKLDVTLTDIMQRLLKKRDYNELKPISKNQTLDKHIISIRNRTLTGLTPKLEENFEPCDQKSGNISSSEHIPETSAKFGPSEGVFLTQEYLENIKSECSLDASAAYYQESFDYMISAEVKSRLSGYNCFEPFLDEKPSLLDRSCDESFINFNYKPANLNESNACNLDESVIVFENTVNSPTDHNFKNDSENIFSQNERVSYNLVENCSPKGLSERIDLELSNNIEIHFGQMPTNTCKSPDQKSYKAGVSSFNNDLMSQGFLQQFDDSFRLEPDNLARQSNLNNVVVGESNISNEKINVSQESSRKDNLKYKGSLYETTLILQNVNSLDENICHGDVILKTKNCAESVDLKNDLSENKLTNSHTISKYKEPNTKCSSETKHVHVDQPSSSLHLEMKNSAHINTNNDSVETVPPDRPVLSQKPASHQKLDSSYGLTTGSGKNIHVSVKSLEKVRSIFTDDLVFSDQDNIWQSFTDSDIVTSNVHLSKFKSDKNIDVLRNESSNVKKTEEKEGINRTLKSPLPGPNNVSNFMFSSAGGKNIEVSEKALAKVKSMFNEILGNDPNENKTSIYQKCETSTINEKTIKLSEDPFVETKSKLNEILGNQRHKIIEDKTCINEETKSPLSSSTKIDNFIISSVGGKNIAISEDSLAKVKSKFKEVSENSPSEGKESDDNHLIKTSFPSCNKNDICMFSTAGGKNITVSDDALSKVESKFKEIMESYEAEEIKENAKSDINNAFKKCLPSSSENDNLMFSTAGGKNIKVSDAALAKVKSKFNEIMESHETKLINDEAETDINSGLKDCLPSSSKNDNPIFSTAGGKNIKVSDAALAKVRSKFNEMMESHETEEIKENAKSDINNAFKKCLPTSSKNDNPMFSTAGGKNIKVSHAALAKVRSHFNEIMESDDTKIINDEAETDISNVPKKCLPSPNKNDKPMFSTAGGKNIKVSDAALAKVRSKFNEIIESHESKVINDEVETYTNNGHKDCLASSSNHGDFIFLSPIENHMRELEEPSLLAESNPRKVLKNQPAAINKNTENKTDTNLYRKTSLYKLNQSVNFKVPHAIRKNSKLSKDVHVQFKSKPIDNFKTMSPEVNNTENDIDTNKTLKMSSRAADTSDGFMFSTARGKNIEVSELALADIKSRFKEIMESDTSEMLKEKSEANTEQLINPSLPCSSKNENFMFSSASGRNIKVSEDALAKVKSKFGEIFEESLTDVNKMEAKTENCVDETLLPSSSKTDNFMFSKASGKNIKVSEDALTEVKSKFGDILEGSLTDLNKIEAETRKHADETSLPSSSKNDNFLFSNASGKSKNTKVSEDALTKVKSKLGAIFEGNLTDLNKMEVETENRADKTSLSSSSNNDNIMFTSASGKNIKVSEDALAKAKSKFGEIFDESLTDVNVITTETENLTDERSLPSSSKNNNFMFSSASGKNIKVSKDALAKVKSKFSDIMESSEMEDIRGNTETNISYEPEKSLPGSWESDNFMFSNACGKDIKVSEDALAKVKSKFGDIMESSEMEDIRGNAETNISYEPEKSLPGSRKSDNFMFSNACGKDIKVSEDALAKVKSKFGAIFEGSLTDLNKMEVDTENCADRTSLSSSSNNDNFMFTSASGKNIKVSEDALAKAKSKFTDILENTLAEYKLGSNQVVLPSSDLRSTAASSNVKVSDVAVAEEENNEVEINEHQLLDTSFLCFDKFDLFSNIDERKNIEISGTVIDIMKSKLNGFSKENSIDIEISLDKSFPSTPKFNEIEHESTQDKCSGIRFSTAGGKHISVSEDALLKARSKFSEIIDCTEMHNITTEKSDEYAFQHVNSPNQNLPVDICLDPLSEKTNTNVIKDRFAQISYKETPASSRNIRKIDIDNKLSICYKNDKKSKSSHSENSTSNQPLAKKICFQPGVTQKPSTDISGHNIPQQSKLPFLTFTQSISQSILDKEMDIIERRQDPKEVPNLSVNDFNLKRDECLESKDSELNKCDDQFSTQDSDLTMIYEVSDSAAAFMADCTPDRSVVSSPSSFFNRKSMKPMKLLEMEFDDVDDEIMVAAELDVIPEPVIKNSLTNSATNGSVDSINFRSCSVEVLSVRNDQRKRMDEIINQKLKNRSLPSPGLYMTLRNKGSLKRIGDNLHPFLNKEQLLALGIKEEILYINSNNAAMYEFCAESFFNYAECFSAKGIIDLEYGFSLILSDDNKIGLSEVSKSFLSNPSIDPSLVPSDWLKNHFKWIVWKLACYERAFPRHLSNNCLTPENVLHQLKYRYDREIDLAQRSALKKILECDEPSSRRLVACVADIRNIDSTEDESNYEIELTDGWYSIWTCIDPAMKYLIDKQKVKIGTKLIIQAAELLNCTEGCDPLQITSSIRLKLHTNSVRRVKWDSKMGFTRHPGPIRVSLRSILKNGGHVGLTSAIIARVYPLLYMSKDADGKTVFRNSYAEHQASNLEENALTLKSEELFEKLFPEIEAKYKNGAIKFDKSNITKINDAELLWKIVSNESDPTEVQSLMTPDQLIKVQKYHESISSKIREEVQALVKKKLEELIPTQKAKCLLKVRLVDPNGSCNAVLTVWSPSEDLLQMLVEKKRFDFYALNACGIRDKVLQLSNTNRTIYKERNLPKPNEEFERKVTPIHDIVGNALTVQFGEMDVVGTVIFVKEPEKPWGVTNVYLSGTQESFLMITFWTSLKTFGCDDALKPGSTVACINLQWRQGSGSYVVPSTYANEMTYFCTNPRQEYLIRSFKEIKSSISSKGLENFMIERRRKLFTILKEREYCSKTPVSRVETPKVLKRLENLKKYGDASPLPKLSLLSSPDVHRKFRSPKSGSL